MGYNGPAPKGANPGPSPSPPAPRVGQAAVPGGLIGSAGVPASGNVFRSSDSPGGTAEPRGSFFKGLLWGLFLGS